MATSASYSCPCAGPVDPTRVAGFAADVGATVAWYTLPDYIRSHPLRGLVRAGLLRILGWSMVAQLPEPSELPLCDDKDVDCSKSSPVAGEDPLEGVTETDPAELAVLASAALGSATITVGAERWLFRRDEGRRAQGARFVYTRQGLALGTLEAGLIALTFDMEAVREKLSRG